MTQSPAGQTARSRLPSRRGVRDGLRAALVPVVACAVTLTGLTIWTSSGAAGSPPRMAVGNGRVFLPYGNSQETAAFFDIVNVGGSADQLTSVTSPAVERSMLSRHASSGLGADTMRMAGSVQVPAGAALTMSPFGVSVMARKKTSTSWRAGDFVPFVLHFRHGPPVEVLAVVIRPGS
ncbi:copper chaperone PCu(A)C [Streptomyces sp. NPDC056491]|uniref:copper chaperone PCu(A)C n=1 Tax=Streptomyces sp. NPDC056491 TaxID=3345837 RepID=UPI0036745902